MFAHPRPRCLFSPGTRCDNNMPSCTCQRLLFFGVALNATSSALLVVSDYTHAYIYEERTGKMGTLLLRPDHTTALPFLLSLPLWEVATGKLDYDSFPDMIWQMEAADRAGRAATAAVDSPATTEPRRIAP